MDVVLLLFVIAVAVIQVIMIVKFFQMASALNYLKNYLKNKEDGSPFYMPLLNKANEELYVGNTAAAKEILMRIRYRIENDPKLKDQTTAKKRGLDMIDKRLAELEKTNSN